MHPTLRDHAHARGPVVQEVTLPDMPHRSVTVPPRALALSVAALAIPAWRRPAPRVARARWSPARRASCSSACVPLDVPPWLAGRVSRFGGWHGSARAHSNRDRLLDLATPQWGSVFALVVILVSVCLGVGASEDAMDSPVVLVAAGRPGPCTRQSVRGGTRSASPIPAPEL